MSTADLSTRESVTGAVAYALATHLAEHGALQRVQGLPAPEPGCAVCLALQRALAVAEADQAPTARRRA
jgi:hypothetical protein